jgi:curli biogenesis system outer membrane secretion channel CsgG
MRLVVGALAVLAAGAMNLAVADPPAQTTAAPTAAAAQTASTTASNTMSVDEKEMRSQGYKPRMHNGEKVWCRQEDQTGTRLAMHGDTCGTVEQIRARTQSAREATEATQRIQVNKSGG